MRSGNLCVCVCVLCAVVSQQKRESALQSQGRERQKVEWNEKDPSLLTFDQQILHSSDEEVQLSCVLTQL